MAQPERGVSFSESSHPDRDARVEKMIATGKYDRKAIRARIELESWMDEQLSELFGDDYDVEIDLDEVMEEDEDARAVLIENILSDAPNPDKVPAFAGDLKSRIEAFLTEYPSLQGSKSRGQLPFA